MNFKPNDVDFLTNYQRLLFSDKLEKGSPSEKANVLRHAIAQLQYARLTGVSKDGVASQLLTDYQDTYSNIVDSFDDNTGLNNYAEGALNLCSGHKNESQSWASSLTVDSVMGLPGMKQLFKDSEKSKDEVLQITKRNERLPKKHPSEQIKINSLDRQTGHIMMDKQSAPSTSKSTMDDRRVREDSHRNNPQEPILNLYQNKGKQQQLNQFTHNQENLLDEGKRNANEDDGFSRMNKKPLFSTGGRSNTQTWQNQKNQQQFGQNNENYGIGKRKMYEDTEDEGDKPVMAGNAFRTAKQQMAIDNHKKYGGGAQQSRGSLNNSSYGTGKKSLGTRRGLNSKFVPPVVNRDEMDTDGNQAANIMTRAVLKTGGNDNPGVKYEGLDDEKLKGIEPKMIELIMNEIMDTGPELTWDDVAGLEYAKKTIKEIVVWPMLRPDIFTGLRGPPKGLLLFGPPGTGKTLIGKCIACQSKSTFFCISASSLTSKWVGEGEKMVRALFAVARAQQPAVIFIDEIDSLLTQRTDGENEASRRIKTEFLVQLDGAATSTDDRVLVIGATNRPQEIDEAARRRFVKRLYIPLPEYEARKTIILNLLKKQSYNLEEHQLDKICTSTQGFSGADMATLCREAALGPIRDMSFCDIEHISADQVRGIQFCDFEDALGAVRPSVSDKDLDLYLEWNKTFGSGSR